jgi:hypothetical protein
MIPQPQAAGDARGSGCDVQGGRGWCVIMPVEARRRPVGGGNPGQGIVTPQGAETRFSVAPVGFSRLEPGPAHRAGWPRGCRFIDGGEVKSRLPVEPSPEIIMTFTVGDTVGGDGGVDAGYRIVESE